MNYRIKKNIRNISNKNRLFKYIYTTANRIKINLLSYIPDEVYARYKYHENTGRKLNLANPKNFNEKIWWMKLNNRDPLLTICSDKYKVRDYVAKVGLKKILIPLIGVYDRPEDINFQKLPERAFIKTNNTSGINRMWNRNKTFNHQKFEKDFKKALSSNYYLQSREWNYKNIPPKIIIEKVIEDKSKTGLVDYRFLCFNGQVKLVLADIETAADDGTHNPDASRNIYDKDFNILNGVKLKRENFNPSLLRKPINFYKMIEYSELLSKPFEFCRVDLYNVEGKIYFGEITFYPGGGTQIFEPLDMEVKVGTWINLKSDKIKLST